MNFKAECTVTLMEGETVQAAAYRQVLEALEQVRSEYPHVEVTVGHWDFTENAFVDNVSLGRWRRGEI